MEDPPYQLFLALQPCRSRTQGIILVYVYPVTQDLIASAISGTRSICMSVVIRLGSPHASELLQRLKYRYLGIWSTKTISCCSLDSKPAYVAILGELPPAFSCKKLRQTGGFRTWSSFRKVSLQPRAVELYWKKEYRLLAWSFNRTRSIQWVQLVVHHSARYFGRQ